MGYEISEKVKSVLAAACADEKIQKALKFMEDDMENIVDKQCELTLIPAPTFHEEKKAARLLEMFKEEGLEDCHIDEYGNVVGIRKGIGGGKTVLVEGHMDTVFAEDTKLEIKRENGWIYCPGIVDDTRGCASVLAVVRALNAADVKTKGDIHFVGTVQEEGMGALQGMQYYVQHHPELEASVSLDGASIESITYQATGIQTYEFNFYGTGGHACGAFGQIANCLAAAGRAMEKIEKIEVPKTPMTTYAVTGCFAGSYSSIHAIVSKATMLLNFRSNSQEELEKLRGKIFAAIEEACKEETERWNCETITYDYKHFVNVNAGAQDCHVPIVEAAYAVSQMLGCENPELAEGGSTNCNRALEAGLPAVCLGGGGYDTRCHSLEERFEVAGSEKAAKHAMMTAIMCSGTETTASIME